MIRCWLLYLAALAATCVFYVFSPGYLSFLLVVVLLLLPIFSLLLTLPGLLTLQLELRATPAALLRGQEQEAQLELIIRSRFPVGRELRGRWTVENLLYPQLTQRGKLRLHPDRPFCLPCPTDHCGWVRGSLLGLRYLDWLGLFPLPCRRPMAALVLVRPVPETEGLPDVLGDQPGQRLQPRPGGGPGEDYELRDYRPGDPVSAIHWKLTAKRPEDQDPVLRETMEPQREALTVTYDHFGTPQEVDRVLERLEGLALQLLEAQRPFRLCHRDSDTGLLITTPVASRDDWERTLRALCAQPAPAVGEPILTGTGPAPGAHARYIHLTGKEPEVTP